MILESVSSSTRADHIRAFHSFDRCFSRECRLIRVSQHPTSRVNHHTIYDEFSNTDIDQCFHLYVAQLHYSREREHDDEHDHSAIFRAMSSSMGS